MKTHKTLALCALCITVAACGDDDEDATGNGGMGDGSPTLEIAGTYEDQFMTQTVFSNDSVNTQSVVEFSNEDNVLFAQNPPDDMFNPNAYSRFVWTEPEADGSFFGCFEVFGAATLEDARADGAMADTSNPTGDMSCGGFQFSDYTPVN